MELESLNLFMKQGTSVSSKQKQREEDPHRPKSMCSRQSEPARSKYFGGVATEKTDSRGETGSVARLSGLSTGSMRK